MPKINTHCIAFPHPYERRKNEEGIKTTDTERMWNWAREAIGADDIFKLQIALELDAKSILTFCDARRRTLLHFASAAGHVDCIRILMHSAQRHLNKTPSESNESKSEESTTGSFARFIAARDANSNAPIHLAVTGNHLEAVAQLVQSGADVSSHDASGRTPIDLVRARTRILKTQLPTIMAFRNDNDRRAISGYSSSSNSDLKHRYLVQLNAMMVILEASIASDRIVSNTATVVKKDDELKKDYPDELISALEYKFKGIKVYQDSQIVNEISELLDSLKM